MIINTNEEYKGYIISRYRAGYGVWVKDEFEKGYQSLEDFSNGKDARFWCDKNDVKQFK